MPEIVLEMKNITKRFPLVVANDKVNFSVYKGEIHALVGENGAGKTTLMSILYGLYQADSGEILINDKKIRITNPNIAIKLKIGMVHQHFMLVPPLTVTENVILGMEPKKNNIFIDIENATKKVKEISEGIGFKIDPNAKIESISVGIQQRVEIIKVLYRGAEILVMDEPTAVLTPQEVEELFGILNSLKKQGKTIIFITHKLNEVQAISDRITVMRRGKVVGVKKTSETNKEEIASMMVGRKVIFKVKKNEHNFGKNVLKVSKLNALNNKGLPALKDISFEIKEGEILGIAGVEGNGQTELVEVITGLRKAKSGKISIYERNITNDSPREIKEEKIAHIPEDRRQRGIISQFNVSENLILGSHYDKPFNNGMSLNLNIINKHADKLIKEYDIRPSDKDNLLKSLSGGNQQKVIVARELFGNPIILIAAQPTRGLDVGSIEFVHQQIINERDKNKGVLLVSADLDEILSLSDRIAVIYEGKIAAILDPKKTNQKELGLLMTGSVQNKKTNLEEVKK
ncbi:MAG: ABC transporter ATP-binding protein [Candidatus Caldatribacteriota bacterium]|nr:ABC transporter ATP-binding protein [Candidatus Caldatribacteriota bacterium]